MSELLPIPKHIETHLGVIEPKHGYWRWKRTDGPPLQVLAFPNKPETGVTTLSTLGISQHELCSDAGPVRQELVLAANSQFVCDALVASLAFVAERVLDTHIALKFGEVFGPYGSILPGSKLEALICLPPDIFPASFGVCSSSDPLTQFIWLAPITVAEVKEAKEQGAKQLVRRWENEETDIYDFNRDNV